ncbi:AAA ATPase midasin [Clydaea vesicula]|uniref:Midasin n=1 Tax=Clydaea vesicula TaxID=447962 RepID=A0AAD5U8B5_9FUNG|nr:AAA ATPase midasin [Clydaea vesicula]
MFDWTALYKLTDCSNSIIRAYAAHTVAIITGMSDKEKTIFLSKKISDSVNFIQENFNEEKKKFEFNLNSASFLPIFEIMELDTDAKLQSFTIYNADIDNSVNDDDTDLIMTEDDLSKYTIYMCGVLLPKPFQTGKSVLNVTKRGLVHTDSTKEYLERIALAVSMRTPILLEGYSGVGKTALIEEAALINGYPDLLKIHLGDQTDSKVLLGTYVATATPGTFRWQPGVLTTAVAEGKWILIEDINLAPTEVISILIPLLESRTLFIPSRGEKVIPKDGFRIFATKTISSKNSYKEKIVANGLWEKIEVKPLSRIELMEVVKISFPSLTSVVSIIVAAFEAVMVEFNKANYGSIGGSHRSLSVRDLIKWCERLEARKVFADSQNSSLMDVDGENEDNVGLELELKENLFREACDCFVSMISSETLRNSILSNLGYTLSIPNHRIDFYINVFVPSIQASTSSIQAGRVELKKFESNRYMMHSGTFATLSHSRRLMEKLAVCIFMNEPVLLVGETGTGKTTVVQHLAGLLNKNLQVVNMSQQSDSSDLLGGFKPVDTRHLAKPLKLKFDILFKKTFSVKKNANFLEVVEKVYSKSKWQQLLTAFFNAFSMAEKVFNKHHENSSSANVPNSIKKIKVLDFGIFDEWLVFHEEVTQFQVQYQHIKNKFLFSFVEGTLVQAVKNGDWVLLDEVNLASAETLECLSGLLQSSSGSLLLLEKGDTVPIERHPEFRLFACMNPANDAGKRDLPPGLRSRFSEFWVDSPDKDQKDLIMLVSQYIKDFLPPGQQGQEIIESTVSFYNSAKERSLNDLFDGANQKIHFSIRTLTRALAYASSITSMYGLRRALYEGLIMTFVTQLNKEGQIKVKTLIDQFILSGIKNPEKFVSQIPKPPQPNKDLPYISDTHELFNSFWIERGPLKVLDENELSSYVLTPSVESNLANVARAIMSHKYPILLQGPTSAGKTSMIEYIAKRTGHKFVRINNHEHTDLQEYVGSYITDNTGKLVFKEVVSCKLFEIFNLVFQGILVQALRKGCWIVLDELNLAPSDVLEALNRLLDDNRELFIPETQEIVKPHPHFLLFATQNPPGLYGGRKVLSRAFRNRFLELHFDDIPESELGTILENRCKIAPSYAKKIVLVFKTLRNARQRSRIFDGKHGYITLRDLFRWAERRAVGYQALAEDGYMILADKIRKDDDKIAVIEALESVFNVKLNVQKMYEDNFEDVKRKILDTYSIKSGKVPEIIKLLNEVVWTKSMKRLFTLVYKCIKHNEAVLLVGETGCGKTTVCQVLAAFLNRKLHIVNAHQHSETSDFLGSQRPVRGKDLIEEEFRIAVKDFFVLNNIAIPENVENSNLGDLMHNVENFLQSNEHSESSANLRLLYKRSQTVFEWHDGPLVEAMKNGDLFLLDEISLADDSVLERLNSVLEPQKLLVLAEKASEDDTVPELYGAEGFEFLATMNPGGDYGKKELSPALRNRFTEVWAPQVSNQEDLLEIINSKFDHDTKRKDLLRSWNTAEKILQFIDWFSVELNKQRETLISLRDILSWVNFIMVTVDLDISESFFHGGCLVIVDGIGVNPLFGLGGMSQQSASELRNKCRITLENIASKEISKSESTSNIEFSGNSFGVHPFYISLGDYAVQEVKFSLNAPTTLNNCMRVLRALQLKKPVLLEGSPGVGKTALIANLAAISGRKLVRINLSEHTDLTDLFGSDLPVEEDYLKNTSGPEFAWRDGPFLQAMKCGDWILLDELNLASQQVLEGLNACLDHRGAVFIPELQREFLCSSKFRVFGAQNPQSQGGGRKGLPKSFVNRFTQVFVTALEEADLKFIVSSLHPRVSDSVASKMISFVDGIHQELIQSRNFGICGSPWEFNLRDIMRWINLVEAFSNEQVITDCSLPGRFLNMVFIQRVRTLEDRMRIKEIFFNVFGSLPNDIDSNPHFRITPDWLEVGETKLQRKTSYLKSSSHIGEIIHNSLPILQSLMNSVKMNEMVLLTGPTACGKSSIIRLLANLTGNELEEFAMNGGVDTVELLGGFEQADLMRRQENIISHIHQVLTLIVRNLLTSDAGRCTDQISLLQSQFKSIEFHESKKKKDWVERTLELLKTLENLEKQMKFGCGHLFFKIYDLVKYYTNLQNRGVHGSFEWIDGTLIRAMEDGHWVLIDNVNFCSPSVLDRLNSLFEPNGTLMINERGLVDGEVKVIKPHSNFRLFLTMDPKYGEISRAMRNRSVELSMVGHEWMPATALATSTKPRIYDFFKIINSHGLHAHYLQENLYKVHCLIYKFNSEFSSNNLKNDIDDYCIVRLCKLILERSQRGGFYKGLLRKCLDDIYMVEDLLSDCGLAVLPIQTKEILLIAQKDILNLIAEMENKLFEMNLTYSSILEHLSMEQSASYFWPKAIDGSFITVNSKLAKISVRGSLIKSFKHLNSDGKTAFALLKHFVKDLNFDEWNLTLIWLAYSSAVTKSPLLCKLLVFLSFEFDKNAILLLRKFEPSTDENISLYQAHLEIWVRSMFLDFESKKEYFENSAKKLSDLSFIQRSFAFNNGKIGHSQLVFDFVQWLYPLFCVLQKVLREYVYSMENKLSLEVLQFLERLENFWYSVQKQMVEFSEFAIVLKRLKKSINSAPISEYLINKNSLQTEVDALINHIETSIGLNSISRLSNMWKSTAVNTLKNAELLETYEKFKENSSFFNLNVANLKCLLVNLASFSDFESLEAVLNGASTLYYLNEQDKFDTATTELVEVLKAVPTAIFLKLKTSKKNYSEKIDKAIKFESQDENSLIIPLNIIEEFTSRFLRLKTIPAFDKFWIIEERKLLFELSKIYSLSTLEEVKHNLVNIIPKLSGYITQSVHWSYRTPIHLEPLKHDKLKQFLKSATLEANLNNSKSTWVQVYSVMYEQLFTYNNPINLGSFIENFDATVNVDLHLGTSLDGPVLFFKPLSAICGMSIVGESLENVPAYAKNIKLQQLSHLKDFYKFEKFELFSYFHTEFLSTITIMEQLIDGLAESSDWARILKNFFHLIRWSFNSVMPLSKENLTLIFESLNNLQNDASLYSGDIPFDLNLMLLSFTDLLAFSPTTYVNLSKFQIDVSLKFFMFYIPQYPVDPAMYAKYKCLFVEDQIEQVNADIEINLGIERNISGNSSNHTLSYFHQKLSEFSKSLKKYASKLKLRPEKSSINELHRDLQLFIQTIASQRIINDLVQEILNPMTINAAKQKEISLQHNLTAFIEKMETKYSLYLDILLPLYFAIYHLKNALKILVENIKTSGDEKFSRSLSKLLSFNEVSSNVNESESVTATIASLSELISITTLNPDEKIKLQWDLTFSSLLRWNCESLTRSLQNDNLKVTHSLFLSLIEIWAKLQKKEEEDQKSADFYKYKVQETKILTEEEFNEQEFSHSFPDYYENFAFAEENSVLNTEIVNKTLKKESYFKIDDITAHQIRLLHMSTVDSALPKSMLFQEVWGNAFYSSFLAIWKIFANSNLNINGSLDDHAHSGLVFLTDASIKALNVGFPNIFGKYDYYKHPNVTEANQVISLLYSFDKRLSELLEQWPDHVMLLQLSRICTRMVSFPITSPIPKFMVGLELLLQKIDDWEKYASRNVSLKGEMQSISNLVVRWRKLELQSWRDLLDLEDYYSYARTSQLWFHMFRMVSGFIVTDAASSEEAVDENSILSVLDQICLTSKFGEYFGRLELLKIFHKYLTNLQTHFSHFTNNLQKLQSMFSNVYHYYGQFQSVISEEIQSKRKSIMKELQDYVQIASWKEVTVFALKESSIRSHHHLNKYLKKYREVLEMSVKELIQQSNVTAVTEKNDDVFTYENVKIDKIQVVQPIEFSNVGKLEIVGSLVNKMWHFHTKNAENSDVKRVVSSLSDVSTEILNTVKSFQEMQLQPNSGSAKLQKTVRKKALVDLHRCLEYLGIPNRSHNAQKNQNTSIIFFKNSFNLAESYAITEKLWENIDISLPSVKKLFLKAWFNSEKYYFKILAKMTKLRSAALAYSRDLTEREMSKSVSFCEELLHHIFIQRDFIIDHSQYFSSLLFLCGNWAKIYKLQISKVKYSLMPGDKFLFALEDSQNKVDDIIVYLNKVQMLLNAENTSTGILNVETIRNDFILLKQVLQNEWEQYAVKDSGEVFVHLVPTSAIKLLRRTVDAIMVLNIEITKAMKHKPELLHTFKDSNSICDTSSIDLHLKNLEYYEHTEEVINSNVLPKNLSDLVDPCVDSLLVSFQELKRLSSEIEATSFDEEVNSDLDEFGLRQGDLMKQFKLISAASTSRQLKSVIQLLRKISATISVKALSDSVENVAPHQPLFLDAIKIVICCLFPLLYQYTQFFQHFMNGLSSYHRELCKLQFILCSTFTNIFQKGYCLPANSKEEEEGADEEAEGTGFAEGQGEKDVSENVEDQEEVEGLKNETQENRGVPIPEEDNAVEMDLDFEGELEDVNNDGEDEEEGKQQDKDELDEQMGDLDTNDADVVDEKMWGDDNEQTTENEKTEKNSSVNAKDNEVETVANESEFKEKTAKEEDGDNSSVKSDAGDNAHEEENEDALAEEEVEDSNQKENVNKMENLEDNSGVDVKNEESGQNKEEEEEELNLGDELNFEENGQEGKEETNDSENIPDSPIPDSECNEKIPEVENNIDENLIEDNFETADKLNTDDALEEENVDADNTPEEEKEENKMNNNDDGGEKQGNLEEEEAEETEDLLTKEEKFNKESFQQNFGVEGDNGDATEGVLENSFANSVDNANTNTSPENTAENGRKGMKEEMQSTDEQKKSSDPNPRRNMGDALKHWMTKLKNLQDNNELEIPEKEEYNNDATDESAAFMYVKEDDLSDAMQALDTATGEQAKENKITKDDKNEINDSEMEDIEMNEEKLPEENVDYDPVSDVKSSNNKGNELSDQMKKSAIETSESNEIIDESKLEIENNHSDDPKIPNLIEEKITRENLLKDLEDLSDDEEKLDYENLRIELDEGTRKWMADPENRENSLQVWRTCCNLTRELSFELSEQLRLILEPTLATKLKGDYKTGKRLNMRKVIPYIASDYKKDKIWMRRTKPSKRTYQIMLAIDDSKSMSESKSIQLAYQSLTLISTALTQLEAGDISVVSFGEEAKLLHPFEKTFNDEAGATVISRFTFDQGKTRVKEMLECCMGIFEHARGSSNSELWQLQIVISDGICEDHEKIRSLVRKAADQKIMIVFLILDCRKESLLKMTTVSYEEDSTGSMVLQMNKYIETFPFDYYITLRKIELLPEVLSETLRQYYSLVGNH